MKRWVKTALCGWYWLRGEASHRGVRVGLLYHSVGGGVPFSVSASEFARHMDYLRKHFRIRRFDELAREAAAERDDWPLACVTFDDGLLDSYEVALPILEERGIKASFFVPLGSIGGEHRAFFGSQPCMNARQVRNVARLGHEVAAHTVSHCDLRAVPLATARDEIVRSKAGLEELLGSGVTTFAYPKGYYNRAVRQVVEEAGFDAATIVGDRLISAALFDPFTVPRVWIHSGMGSMQFRAFLSPVVERLHELRDRISFPPAGFASRRAKPSIEI